MASLPNTINRDLVSEFLRAEFDRYLLDMDAHLSVTKKGKKDYFRYDCILSSSWGGRAILADFEIRSTGVDIDDLQIEIDWGANLSKSSPYWRSIVGGENIKHLWMRILA